MFHVEIRSGMQVVREFNLDDRGLYAGFLEPLLSDREFTIEGHEFVPRHTRIVILEGPELRLDQLGMGRGWGNAERTAADVTERVLQQARDFARRPQQALPASWDLVRERLLGRIAAGPISADEILAIAVELMPDSSETERLDVAQHAAWELLVRGAAQLTPSGK